MQNFLVISSNGPTVSIVIEANYCIELDEQRQMVFCVILFVGFIQPGVYLVRKKDFHLYPVV